MNELRSDPAAGKCIAQALARERKRRMARAASDNSTFTAFLQSSFHDFAIFLVEEVRAERNQAIARLEAQVHVLRTHIQEAQDKYVAQGPAGVMACMRDNAELLASSANAAGNTHYVDINGPEVAELLKIATEKDCRASWMSAIQQWFKNTKAKESVGSGIFVRRNGASVEISPAEWLRTPKLIASMYYGIGAAPKRNGK